jgi:hypothetical protein
MPAKLHVVDFSFFIQEDLHDLGRTDRRCAVSAASHGTDLSHRPTAARRQNLRDAQRALIGSGLFIIVQFALFLLVGTSLWLAGADQPGMRGDAIYPTFIVTHLPEGLAGLAVGGFWPRP